MFIQHILDSQFHKAITRNSNSMYTSILEFEYINIIRSYSMAHNMLHRNHQIYRIHRTHSTLL